MGDDSSSVWYPLNSFADAVFVCCRLPCERHRLIAKPRSSAAPGAPAVASSSDSQLHAALERDSSGLDLQLLMSQLKRPTACGHSHDSSPKYWHLASAALHDFLGEFAPPTALIFQPALQCKTRPLTRLRCIVTSPPEGLWSSSPPPLVGRVPAAARRLSGESGAGQSPSH